MATQERGTAHGRTSAISDRCRRGSGGGEAELTTNRRRRADQREAVTKGNGKTV